MSCWSLILFAVGTFSVLTGILYSDPLSTEQSSTMLLEKSPLKFSVVLIVVDAFRQDYYKQWQNIRQYIDRNADKAKFIKVKANAPTMTAERIQTMMVGAEMTQPSILSNFLSTKINIDNIVRKTDKSLLLGDDTWDKIFTFSKSITCRSFEVFDLDSCDNTVSTNIFNEIGKYDLIVGHMLGLDHIGHTYSSVDVLKMSHKLQEI